MIARTAISVILLLVVTAFPAAAKRVALVIGNDSYATLDNLNNARKDARDMAAKLEDLDFEVILKLDAGRLEIGRALTTFRNRLAGSEAGLVFYAGHGIEADGRNWLIPSDAQVESDDDLAFQALDARDFLTYMQQAGVPVNIVILDACRNNPLPKRTRSAARGLSVSSTPVIKGMGTVMLFSAGPGEQAADGLKGGNGVFTGALLKALDHPGLKVEDVFKRTARAVQRITGKQQTPAYSTTLTGDFYFRPGGGGDDDEKGDSEPDSVPDPVDDQTRMQVELAFWKSIGNSDNVALYDKYLLQYPQGSFAELAREKIKELTPPDLSAGDVFRDCGDTVVASGGSLPSGVFCGPELVVVPPGSFVMGSNDGQDDEDPPHQVSIDYSFAVGKYEVKQSEWQSVMGSNPSVFKDGNRPVEKVSWEDAQEFIAKLNDRTGRSYRLLSEAEWEYVARGGTSTKYSWGNSIGSGNANCDGCGSRWDNKETAPVGSFGANGFGLYDMHGNVWEWVADCYDKNAYETHQSYPQMVGTWHDSCNRVVRGGSWDDDPLVLRSAVRLGGSPTDRDSNLGFRVARTVFGS